MDKGLTTNQARIVQLVLDKAGMSLEQIKVQDRKRELVKWRNILCYCLRIYGNMKLTAIGRLLGRDHGSVIHSIYQVKDVLTMPSDVFYFDYVAITDRCSKIGPVLDARICKEMQKQGSSIAAMVGMPIDSNIIQHRLNQ